MGTVEDIVFEDFILDRVGKAINVNPYGQGVAADLGVGAIGVGAIRVANITFRNFRGTAKVPGTFSCDDHEQCTGFTMENVNITGTTAGYSCKGNVTGTATGCSP